VLFEAEEVPVGGHPPEVVAGALDAFGFHGLLHGLDGARHVVGPPPISDPLHVRVHPVPRLAVLVPHADARHPAINEVLPPPAAPDLVHRLLLTGPVLSILLPRCVLHRLPVSGHFPVGQR